MQDTPSAVVTDGMRRLRAGLFPSPEALATSVNTTSSSEPTSPPPDLTVVTASVVGGHRDGDLAVESRVISGNTHMRQGAAFDETDVQKREEVPVCVCVCDMFMHACEKEGEKFSCMCVRVCSSAQCMRRTDDASACLAAFEAGGRRAECGSPRSREGSSAAE